MKIDFIELADWPPLAWLAFIDSKRPQLTVWHGPQVETSELGFCEAIWDGEFEQFDFDKTDLVFGSGCRLRDDCITFVSAGSTVDRLQFYRRDDGICVANSLACLAEFNDLTVDVTADNYYQDFRSIEKGLARAVKQLATDKGPVELVYFHNIRWDGSTLNVVEKPRGDRRFRDFAAFEHFLRQSVSALGHNMRSYARQRRYDPLGTLSTGYDSPVVAILGKHIGCRQVISFSAARGGLDDHGGDIARCLDLEVISADRNDWRRLKLAEVPFLAANGYGEEVHYATLGSQLQGKVLMTGFHGDKVWGKKLIDQSDNIVRGDPTGLGLAEYRLWQGFIHCPIPFMGARNVTEINRISNSAELKPWDIPGDYSRPLCRRIIEDAGVPREFFGMEKKAASVVLRKREDAFLSATSHDSYDEWLSERRPLWWQRWRLPPQLRPDPYNWPLVRPLADVGMDISLKLESLPGGWRLVKLFEDLKIRPTSPFVFPWALHQARQRYRHEDLVLPAPKAQIRAAAAEPQEIAS